MNKKGFTLVELLAVIAILAILVIIALPNVLKMFNDAKKNSFLTEAKTVYSEISKKYISESMKGNKLTYVSSEDDTKLEMTGRDLQYCVFLNADGTIKSMKVSNGEYIAKLPLDKKITDLTSADLKDGNLDDYDCAHPFKSDSWNEIALNARDCVNNPDSCPYKVGDEKEVKLEKYGTHKVRISNMSTPNECNNSDFSQSACGFVIEFCDVITTYNINTRGEYKGITYPYGWNKDGWPESLMYKFLNDESLDGTNDKELSIINALPNELKSVIIDTKTVSGHGSEDTDNFISMDKLYLLATAEIWSLGTSKTIDGDTARDLTRQLDYYKGVTTNSYAKAIKNNSAGSASYWWSRSAYSNLNSHFYFIDAYGGWNIIAVAYEHGVSPAFRIG